MQRWPARLGMVLAPALVILSSLLGFTALTLVFSPMLVVAVFLAVLVAALLTVVAGLLMPRVRADDAVGPATPREPRAEPAR